MMRFHKIGWVASIVFTISSATLAADPVRVDPQLFLKQGWLLGKSAVEEEAAERLLSATELDPAGAELVKQASAKLDADPVKGRDALKSRLDICEKKETREQPLQTMGETYFNGGEAIYSLLPIPWTEKMNASWAAKRGELAEEELSQAVALVQDQLSALLKEKPLITSVRPLRITADYVLYGGTADLKICLSPDISLGEARHFFTHELVHFLKRGELRHAFSPEFFDGIDDYVTRQLLEPGSEVEAYIVGWGAQIRSGDLKGIPETALSFFNERGEFQGQKSDLLPIIANTLGYAEKLKRDYVEEFNSQAESAYKFLTTLKDWHNAHRDAYYQNISLLSQPGLSATDQRGILLELDKLAASAERLRKEFDAFSTLYQRYKKVLLRNSRPLVPQSEKGISQAD